MYKDCDRYHATRSYRAAMIRSLLLRLLLHYYFTTTTSQFSGHFPIEQHSWLESYALSVYTTSSTEIEVHACDASKTKTETLSDLGLNLTATPMPFRHANLYMALNVVQVSKKKAHCRAPPKSGQNTGALGSPHTSVLLLGFQGGA